MKIKSGFVLHSVGDENVVVAIGKRTAEFRGMIRLNGSGAFLFKLLEKDTDVASLENALIEHYEITRELATEAVSSFVSQLENAGVLEK